MNTIIETTKEIFFDQNLCLSDVIISSLIEKSLRLSWKLTNTDRWWDNTKSRYFRDPKLRKGRINFSIIISFCAKNRHSSDRRPRPAANKHFSTARSLNDEQKWWGEVVRAPNVECGRKKAQKIINTRSKNEIEGGSRIEHEQRETHEINKNSKVFRCWNV